MPAGDPPDGEDACVCGDFLLTEVGDPLQNEMTSYLSPEE